MKKFALLAMFTLFSTLSHAQFFSNVGIKSGVVLANQDWRIRGDESFDTEYRSGLYIGITSEILKKEVFSLGLDLGYIQKGRKQEAELTSTTNPDGTGIIISLDDRFDFLGFSPTAKFRLPSHKLSPYIFAGPRFDFYLGHNSKGSFQNPEPDNINTAIFGLNYGLGLDYQCGKSLILAVEFQHQPDFTYLVNREPSQTTLGYHLQNRAFLATLGVKYVLK